MRLTAAIIPVDNSTGFTLNFKYKNSAWNELQENNPAVPFMQHEALEYCFVKTILLVQHQEIYTVSTLHRL
jgi:hypothetical protein